MNSPPIANDRYNDLPHNLELEQALLGAILTNNDTFLAVSDFLQPEHFFDPIHARLYETATDMIGQGRLASPATLRERFDRDPSLTDIGGADYLKNLAAAAVTLMGAEDYGRNIVELARRRELIRLGRQMIGVALDPEPGETADAQIERAQSALDGVAGTSADRGPQPFASVIPEALTETEAACRNEEGPTGIPTGLLAVDELLGGLHAGELVVLAGRPGMGKSAIAGHIALAAAKASRTVAFFSLEMDRRDIGRRAMAAATGEPYEDMRRGRLSEDAIARIRAASADLADLPLYIDEAAGLSVAQVRSRARRIAHRHGLGLIVVDYLQLLRAGDRYRGNRVAETTEVSGALKALAKNLGVPVLAVSQLSRNVEQRDNKRPYLGDLRDSGAIEQDADVVIFCYREQVYIERAEPTTTNKHEAWAARLSDCYGKMELIVAKNRHGRTTTLTIAADMPTASFGTPTSTTGVEHVRLRAS